ncbi:DUF664 domain-containing protein [Streptomyces sp. NBC_01615]|uniref:mycothiol transferase n=1 Tax=Streptomyces sp. NBC_01615 TaxID=2975898 RepID=UPI003869DE9D
MQPTFTGVSSRGAFRVRDLVGSIRLPGRPPVPHAVEAAREERGCGLGQRGDHGVAYGDAHTVADQVDPGDLDGRPGDGRLSLNRRRSSRFSSSAARCPLGRGRRQRLRAGGPVNRRWLYTHMIKKYARHIDDADLIRERIEGATGE